jgi:antitoxin (DNA-binding transcriptional repressor) of toxin-antitoxin stability system
MNETVMTIEDAAARLPELVEQIRVQREAAVILRAGRPVARIVPVPAAGEVSEDLIAFLRRWQSEYPGPDERLADDIEDSRRAVQPPRDPWD